MTDEFGAFNPFEEVEETSNNERVSDEDTSEKKSSSEAEMPKTEDQKSSTQQKDEARLSEIEDEYQELDEDLLDIDDGEDTLWMIKKVSVGILKIIGAIGIIVLILWIIWGGDDSIDKSITKSPAKKIEKIESQKVAKPISAKKSKSTQKQNKKEGGFFSKLFGGNNNSPVSTSKKEPITDLQETKSNNTVNENKNSRKTPAVVYQNNKTQTIDTENHKNRNFAGNATNLATVQIMAWNYWLENDRLLGQKNTPGEVALWTKDAESLFDVPFAEQVKGRNDFEREKKVNTLVTETTKLLQRAENLQTKLLREQREYEAKEKSYIAEATEYERLFLEAMNKSDPAGIDQFLAKKIEAEKKQLENGIEKESRQYLAEKIDSYAQVLVNLREYLIANRKALIKDVQVVQFPEDPFHRIIPLETWEQLRTKK